MPLVQTNRISVFPLIDKENFPCLSDCLVFASVKGNISFQVGVELAPPRFDTVEIQLLAREPVALQNKLKRESRNNSRLHSMLLKKLDSPISQVGGGPVLQSEFSVHIWKHFVKTRKQSSLQNVPFLHQYVFLFSRFFDRVLMKQ